MENQLKEYIKDLLIWCYAFSGECAQLYVEKCKYSYKEYKEIYLGLKKELEKERQIFLLNLFPEEIENNKLLKQVNSNFSEAHAVFMEKIKVGDQDHMSSVLEEAGYKMMKFITKKTLSEFGVIRSSSE